MTTTKSAITTTVQSGQQAVLILLLAKNPKGEPISPSQLALVANKAVNELEQAYAEVEPQYGAFMFDPVAVGEVALLKASIDTTDDPNYTPEPEEEPTPDAEDPEPDETEEPTETDGEE
jgi:hypothetical protein